jgi:hypothetical protein
MPYCLCLAPGAGAALFLACCLVPGLLVPGAWCLVPEPGTWVPLVLCSAGAWSA